MASIQDLTDRLETGLSLKYIAQSYTEISARKLKEIRRDVERNRSFFSELSNLYHAIKVVAAEKYHLFSQKNSKVAVVLLTSNFRFYGSLNTRLVDFFVKETKSRPGDYFLVGKAGEELLKTHDFSANYETVIFKKDLPSNEELKSLVGRLLAYKQVLVFYPQFQSILLQQPVVKDITESQVVKEFNETEHQGLLDAILGKHPTWSDDYIFEPSIEKILEFFDTQMITLLIEETFLEAELAKTAARLVTMDQAQIKAEEYVSTERRDLARAVIALKNGHLLESFISKQQKYTIKHANS